MTQIYRINTSGGFWRENAEEIVREWRNFEPVGKIMYETAQIDEEQMMHLNEQHIQTNGFIALYRKKGRNYIWRGNMVPIAVSNRILLSLGDLSGTLLLYKAGQTRNRNPTVKYPLRLSGNRYVFLTGSNTFLLKYAIEEGLADAEEPQYYTIPSFLLWASEHLVDYQRYFGDMAFKRRAFYAYIMDQFMDEDTFKQDYGEYREVQRSAYCVWKDGEIIEWWRYGEDIHPKI